MPSDVCNKQGVGWNERWLDAIAEGGMTVDAGDASKDTDGIQRRQWTVRKKLLKSSPHLVVSLASRRDRRERSL